VRGKRLVREGRGVELAKACLISALRRNILVCNGMVLRAQLRATPLIGRIVYMTHSILFARGQIWLRVFLAENELL
jgi:hypothetical protein